MAARKVLGLDADGVVLDYLSGFMGYLESRGVQLACRPHEVNCWGMSNALPGWEHERIMDMVREFSVHPDFARIPVMPGAVEGVEAIRRELGDVDLVAVTSAGTSPETARLRAVNLEAFGFDDIHVLPLGADKKAHLSRLPRGSVFVDDLYKNVLAAEEAGLQGILFRQLYNAADDHARVIECWPRGHRTICEVLGSAPAPSTA